MMNELSVRQIEAADTIELRWPILRAGLPRESAIFEGDHEPATRHFGCFRGETLLGVATLVSAPVPVGPPGKPALQLRGMAVQPEARGLGCGKALVRACKEEGRRRGVAVLWCNARTPAVEFYRQHGFTSVGEEFEIPTAGPHFRMFVEL